MNYIARLAASFALLAGGLPAAELFVPSQYPTIQSAVDSAADGDIITISPGTYIENIKVKGSNLTFRSIDPDNLDVRNSTRVIVAVLSSLFDFTDNSTTGEFRIQGLYLSGASQNYGGAIYGNPELSIIIENCTFFFCNTQLEGGAVFNTKGIIRNSLFQECIVSTGDATALFTLGAAIARFDGLIENCDFRDNVSSGISASNN
ncbi:MAG: hypothetical protein SFY68_11920, partial [Candidatus Sumerlaeia bacterium]|nr:hypothetical protein [Candidatus Sumerlaeia bacterium]